MAEHCQNTNPFYRMRIYTEANFTVSPCILIQWIFIHQLMHVYIQ